METIVLTHEVNEYPDKDRKSIDVRNKQLFIVKKLQWSEGATGQIVGYFNEQMNWFIDNERAYIIDEFYDYLIFRLHNSHNGDVVSFNLDIKESKIPISINNQWSNAINIPHGLGVKIHFQTGNFYYRICDYTNNRNVGSNGILLEKNEKNPYFISFDNDDDELTSMQNAVISFKTFDNKKVDITIEFVDK